MKLLFVTMEGCSTCILKREMVFEKVPTVFPGIEIEEIDLNDWDLVTEIVGRELPNNDMAPGYIMLDDDGKVMFQVVGVPGTGYLHRLVKIYKLVTSLPASDEGDDTAELPILLVECFGGECMR